MQIHLLIIAVMIFYVSPNHGIRRFALVSINANQHIQNPFNHPYPLLRAGNIPPCNIIAVHLRRDSLVCRRRGIQRSRDEPCPHFLYSSVRHRPRRHRLMPTLRNSWLGSLRRRFCPPWKKRLAVSKRPLITTMRRMINPPFLDRKTRFICFLGFVDGPRCRFDSLTYIF